jgi:hypothetical protein
MKRMGSEPGPKRFFVPGRAVDGVPTYHDEWRIWNGREWVPLTSYMAFGIRPAPHPIIPAPPIPKHQRRME